jgi:hypothetical protein
MQSYYYVDSDSDSDSDNDDSYRGNRSNRAKPTCNKPDHTLPEPDHHNKDSNEIKDNGYKLEGLEFKSDETDVHKERKGEVNGEYGHERPKPGNCKTYELRELEHRSQEPGTSVGQINPTLNF